MDVIIVSKTHMTNSTCVGGLSADGKFLRLLDSKGYNQPTDTDFEIRQVWDIEFEARTNLEPPHVESAPQCKIEAPVPFAYKPDVVNGL